MNAERQDKRLDDLIHAAIGRQSRPFDFEQWRQKHQPSVECFEAQPAMAEASQSLILRSICRSRVARIAVAAGFVVAAGLVVSYLATFFDATAPVYAITDMPKVLARAATIHATGWRYFDDRMTSNGRAIPPIPIELWLDLVHGRDRQTTNSVSGRMDDIKVSVGELIRDSQRMFRLSHTRKTASFYPLSEHSEVGAPSSADAGVRLLLGDFTQLASAVKVGEERVDGEQCEVWQWERVNQVTGSGHRSRFWLSPATGQTKRVQSWVKWRDTDWRLDEEYTRIEIDVPISDDIFAMEVPAGYEAENSGETAKSAISRPSNRGGYVDDKCDLSYGETRSFTLSDGSVIWGWWSVDKMSQIPRGAYFASVEPGGPLPKLPIEFNALVPAGVPSDVTYWGYHLMFTLKHYADQEEIFTEWALYVPDGTPPATVEEFGCDARSVFNLDHTPSLRIGLPVPYGRRIETAEDFDRWVLPAVAETSDTNQPPERLMFDGVLHLAAQIRQSLTEGKADVTP
jgi:hypothetical protein